MDPPHPATPRPPATAEVVVLGAGLAGLAASVELAQAGVDVQVLEARGRVGGRVWTVREPFDDGLHAEGGAEFISAGHELLRAYLRRFGVPTRPRRFGHRLFYFGGQARRGEGFRDHGHRFARDAARLAEAALDVAARVPDPQRPWDGPAAAELDGRSYGAWLDGLQLDSLVRAQQETWVTIDYGIEPDQLSLLMFARDERLIQLSPADPPNVCAFGGADQLPRAMAAALGPRLHLERPATAISQDPAGPTVHYGGPDGGGTLVARFAVVAVPFTALRHIALEPPLDPERRTVIAGLRYGHVLKLLLQFRRRFWREQGVDGALTDLPFRSAYDATHAQPGPRGILTIYIAGRSAAELAGLSDEARLANVLAQLEQVFPGCAAELERAVHVVWDNQPTSGGAYSHFGPGELTRFGPLVAAPLGRLHFAGEHTDAWQATMNGALSSGLRAAAEILARRQANPT